MLNFKINVVTHMKVVVKQEAEFLRVRTIEGELGILPNYAPFIGELVMSKMEIEYNQKRSRDVYFISGGFIEISNNEITIVADDVIRLEDINIEFEEEEIKKMKSLIKQGNNKDNIYLIEQKLKESEMKIQLKKEYKN